MSWTLFVLAALLGMAPQEHEHHHHPPSPPPAAEILLQQDAFDAPAETSVLDARRSEEMNQGMSGHSHGAGTYRHVDAGRDAAEPQHHDHADAAAVYTCPMHPDVTSDKPGTCPKCGMNLERRKE